jgi:fructose-bisphosphate aldolase class I
VCAFLGALHAIPERPWDVTFSFGRALVSAALHTWAGDPALVTAAQDVLLANCENAASAAR